MLSDITYFKDLKLEASFKNVKMATFSTSSLEMYPSNSKEYGSVSTRTHDESSEKPFLFNLDTGNKGQVFSNKKSIFNECLQAYLPLRPVGLLGQDGSGGCRGGAGRLRSQGYGGGYHGGAAGHLVQGAGHAGAGDDKVGR